MVFETTDNLFVKVTDSYLTSAYLGSRNANAQIGRFAEACAETKGVCITRRGAAVTAAGQSLDETCGQWQRTGGMR